MKTLYNVPADFEADIRVYSAAEGGRTRPVFNGIRWDLAYADDRKATLHMIWPDFIDSGGESLPVDQPLPIDVPLPARMTIVVDEMREEVHRARLAVGVRFFCHEGPRRVAEGTVTRIVALNTPRLREAVT